MSLMNTEVIDNINKQIEAVITTADNICDVINEEIAGKQSQAQDIVNKKVAELSDTINEKGNDIRNNIVDVFSSQYQSALKMIEPIEPLLNISITPNTVVSVVTSIVSIITKPYQPIIEFTTILIPKVLELSENLQKLATYQPQINVPEGVTIPSITIDIEPITASDITGGN